MANYRNLLDELWCSPKDIVNIAWRSYQITARAHFLTRCIIRHQPKLIQRSSTQSTLQPFNRLQGITVLILESKIW